MLEIISIRKGNGVRTAPLAMAVLAASCLQGCGYNRLQNQDEDLRASWSDVANQYERRSELIPNLVHTVERYTNQRLQTFAGVTEARAEEAGSIQPTPELVNDPQAFAKFQQMQGRLSAALQDLFAVADGYPQLQSDPNFRDLELALTGTEGRIAAARDRYVDAVRHYNGTVRSFPSSLTARVFDYKLKPDFTLGTEPVASPPPTDFGDVQAASAAPTSGQPARR